MLDLFNKESYELCSPNIPILDPLLYKSCYLLSISILLFEYLSCKEIPSYTLDKKYKLNYPISF